MSEENAVVETSDVSSGDVGISESVEPQSTGASSSSGSMVSAERYYYDDGCGYVDSKTGNPVMHNGKYVTTQDQLNEMVGKSANAKTNVQRPEVRTSQTGTDPVFGTFDPVKSTGYFKTLMQKNTGYNSQLKVQQPTQEKAPQQQAIQQEAEQQISIYDEVETYKSNLKNVVLTPLEKAAKAMQAAGVWTNDNPEAVELDQQIRDTTEKLNSLAKKKEIELFQNLLKSGKEKDSAKQKAEEVANTVKQARFNVGKDFGGEDGLNWLLVGKHAVDAKGNPVLGNDGKAKFIRGPGADLFESMVDYLYDGKEGVSTEDAYNETANKLQMNEQGLRTLAYASYAIWALENMKQYNASLKEDVLKEERARNKNNIQRPQGMNHIPQAVDGMPPELSKFLGLSSV